MRLPCVYLPDAIYRYCRKKEKQYQICHVARRRRSIRLSKCRPSCENTKTGAPPPPVGRARALFSKTARRVTSGASGCVATETFKSVRPDKPAPRRKKPKNPRCVAPPRTRKGCQRPIGVHPRSSVASSFFCAPCTKMHKREIAASPKGPCNSHKTSYLSEIAFVPQKSAIGSAPGCPGLRAQSQAPDGILKPASVRFSSPNTPQIAAPTIAFSRDGNETGPIPRPRKKPWFVYNNAQGTFRANPWRLSATH